MVARRTRPVAGLTGEGLQLGLPSQKRWPAEAHDAAW